MDIVCHHCQAKFKLPDEKVPAGKTFTVTCPRCKKKLTRAATPPLEPAAPASLAEEVAAGTYDAAQRPFDFLEEGAKTAIVCENDPEYQIKIQEALKGMGFYITRASSARDMLKRMRFHTFDLVVIDERFDAADPDRNSVLRYFERMPMSARRNIFVALIQALPHHGRHGGLQQERQPRGQRHQPRRLGQDPQARHFGPPKFLPALHGGAGAYREDLSHDVYLRRLSSRNDAAKPEAPGGR
jgi:predicted Zn finger-like uncharacterized protein